jgi:fructose-specific phosphotransferase system IIC component/fructose-specific phosphotransferase system IIB component
VRQHLLTGVSYAIPFIACGGVLLAVAIALAPMTPSGPDFDASPLVHALHELGTAAFALMLPVLGGYISYAIAGRPGLVPGFVGGALAGSIGAGFLGALLAGLLAGHVAEWIKRMPAPAWVRPVMPILILPIASTLIVGAAMRWVVGAPIASLMNAAMNLLANLNAGNRAVLGLILGGMIAVDMGGPINKTAFFFGAAMIQQGDVRIMGACAAAICTPPLGLGLATVLRRHWWTSEEREAGLAGLTMGMVGITEGAIPFAAADPLRVIPCIMAGSMVASVIAMLAGVGDHAPHGGPIVLPVIDHKFAYGLAVLAGTAVTSLSISVLRYRSRRAASGSGKGAGMKIVAVTACPTGIAHTYMAAEQLGKTARALGHQIKVETQGAMGIENELSEGDIREAQVAIFAVDIEIEKRERFQSIKVVQVPVQEAIRDAGGLIARVSASARPGTVTCA